MGPRRRETQIIWDIRDTYVERQLGPDGYLDLIQGFANKAPEHAARIAAVLTLYEDLDAKEVPPEMMGQGITLARHYLAEAHRLRGWAATDPHLRLCQRVWDWIGEHYSEPIIYPAVVYQGGPTRAVRDSATTKRIFKTLTESGYLFPIEGGAAVGGKKRKEAWRIYGRTP